MKKANILGFALCLFLVACTTPMIGKMYIYEMKNFTEVREGSLLVISDSKIINNLDKAFKNADQQPGIPNMTDPHYRIELGEEMYFLWLDKTSGAILNTKDTHTLYTLSPQNVKDLNRLLK